MSKSNKRSVLLAVLSALPITLTIQMVDSPINWFAYTLFFYTLISINSPRTAFYRGLVTGCVAAILCFFWILAGTEKFSGKGLFLGLIIFVIFVVLFSVYAGFLAWFVTLMKRKRPYKNEWLWNGLYLACFTVLLDGFMIIFAKGFALCLFVIYMGVAQNLYAIQPATFFGPLIITFVLIFVNHSAAYFLWKRRWKMLLIPICIIVGYLITGFIFLKNYESKENVPSFAAKPTFKAAILAQNVSPEFKWDSVNGNALANQMFQMNKALTRTGANLAIWSETAIPWNYTPDDDFLMRIDSITSAANITHLIGMNTDYDVPTRTFYNSIYEMQPGRKVTGRYYKREALSLIEKPFAGLLIPFFNSTGFRVKEGDSDEPLVTPYGNAGILLCNESALPILSYKNARAGAQFFVNSGNDGWFSDTYISKQHLYHTRLRAVETRKDFIVNNNDGYSGKIESTGKLDGIKNSKEAYIGLASVAPNDYQTFVSRYPYWFLIICCVAFVLFVYFNTIVGRAKAGHLS